MKGLALAAAVGTALVVAAGAAATPEPGPGPSTSTCDGVAVVVDGGALDAGPLGSASTLACASVDRTVTADDAVRAAGIELQGTDQWGAAFVCRVGGRPAVEEVVRRADGSVGTESCVRTPSQGAHWALWTSSGGSTWVYATLGATSLEVAPGDAVGLVFVTSAQPGPPQITPVDALEGTVPEGWAGGALAEEGAAADGTTPGGPESSAASSGASTDVDGSSSAVALAGVAIAAVLLVVAAVGSRVRRS